MARASGDAYKHRKSSVNSHITREFSTVFKSSALIGSDRRTMRAPLSPVPAHMKQEITVGILQQIKKQGDLTFDNTDEPNLEKIRRDRRL